MELNEIKFFVFRMAAPAANPIACSVMMNNFNTEIRCSHLKQAMGVAAKHCRAPIITKFPNKPFICHPMH